MTRSYTEKRTEDDKRGRRERFLQRDEEGKIPAEGYGIELLMIPVQFSSEKSASLTTMLV